MGAFDGLADSKKEVIHEFVHSGVPDFHCPMCGGKSFAIYPDAVSLNKKLEQGGVAMGAGTFAMIECEKCHCMQLFNLAEVLK